MGETTVNGDMPHSAFLEHFESYPVVHDLTEYFKNNPYGQKSIDLTNAVYIKLAKPVLPYFETPASYARPYVIKVDEYGNLFLDKIDERMPILKSETKEVKEKVIGYIHWPLKKADDTKTWVLDTYNEEYKKCGGDGYVAGGKAVITSSLVLTSEILNWVNAYLTAKKEEAKEVAKDAEQKASN